MTEEHNKFELYTDLVDDDEFSYDPLKDSIAEVVGLSDFSSDDLQHEIHGLDTITTYRILAIGKRQVDGSSISLLGYTQSPFRVFGSYLRVLVGLDEDDTQLVSKQYNSFSIINELTPGI